MTHRVEQLLLGHRSCDFREDFDGFQGRVWATADLLDLSALFR